VQTHTALLIEQGRLHSFDNRKWGVTLPFGTPFSCRNSTYTLPANLMRSRLAHWQRNERGVGQSVVKDFGRNPFAANIFPEIVVLNAFAGGL
jgi:hypothetical protein